MNSTHFDYRRHLTTHFPLFRNAAPATIKSSRINNSEARGLALLERISRFIRAPMLRVVASFGPSESVFG